MKDLGSICDESVRNSGPDKTTHFRLVRPVGWVERSEPHHVLMVGLAALDPPYTFFSIPRYNEACAGDSSSTEGPSPMKLIIAIIQPTKLEAVKEALSQVEVFRLTVTDVQGFGRQKGYTEVYRGHEITVNLLRKIELQIAVNEDFVEPTVNAIIQAGRSGPDGKIGDGKIFILPMDDCIRIRTGERGPEAI